MTERMSEVTLTRAREILRADLEEGAKCPCCTQFAKVYRRRIGSASAMALVLLHRDAGTAWVHLPTFLKERQGNAHTGDVAKARYWGLVEPVDATRDDGSYRVGTWRLTEQGVRFAAGRLRVPKYARIYDGRLLGLDAEEWVDIKECLGHKFDYRELMEGV